MSDYINIGKFVSAFGLTGELVLKHALGKKTIFKEIEVLFVEQLLPSFAQEFQPLSKLLFHFEKKRVKKECT